MILAYEAHELTEQSASFKEILVDLEKSITNAAQNGFYNVNKLIYKPVCASILQRIDKFMKDAGYTVKIENHKSSVTIELDWKGVNFT